MLFFFYFTCVFNCILYLVSRVLMYSVQQFGLLWCVKWFTNRLDWKIHKDYNNKACSLTLSCKWLWGGIRRITKRNVFIANPLRKAWYPVLVHSFSFIHIFKSWCKKKKKVQFLANARLFFLTKTALMKALMLQSITNGNLEKLQEKLNTHIRFSTHYIQYW